MRLNKFIANNTHLSRRSADVAISNGRVKVNDKVAELGYTLTPDDQVSLDGKIISKSNSKNILVLFNKPVGYVCSKKGQGSKTIYDILPEKYRSLNPIGRLDKDSSGLLILTNDGQLANKLSHPKYQKLKIYEIKLDKPLQPLHQQMISDIGITLEDGISRLFLEKLGDKSFRVTMHEGRNRQIRRTFEALSYSVKYLHRTQLDKYSLDDLESGGTKQIPLN